MKLPSKSTFCNPVFRWFAIGIAIGMAMSASSKSRAETFEGLDVKVTGKGSPMVFIPGLNSASEVFTETCDAVKKEHTCHLLQLPGFAGQPSLESANSDFLNTMRDSVIHYIDSKKLKHVALVGHSLGGTLSLMIAIKAPQLVDKLVIIDALPFYAAVQNPATTADAMRPVAASIRNAMKEQAQDAYRQSAVNNLQGMTNNPARMPTLIKWLDGSDRNTTAQAMYDMMTTDLRQPIAAIQQPILVLGAWAAYKQYGSTKESTKAVYAAQYAQAKNVTVEMADTSYHFISWDEPQWLVEQIRTFTK
ncbi:MAG TPA: alpha/beta hydrolase [Steroidobacteraceae bacterium]|nr:alpha/beta hydrolase [Steroidobacteraceae bacterium]